MSRKRKRVGILFFPAKAEVISQPKGVVGIIAPWNYPIMLSLGPLTAALAAGNRAIIKMSELTPRTSTLLKKLFCKHFSHEKVCIVDGDVSVAKAFASLPFDHLFFTGSTSVGRDIMRSAAENLVPITLELGGKSPAIIDTKISIKSAVTRFILGKTVNAGQTCVAPDYIFCPEAKVDELVREVSVQFSKMYPSLTENKDCSSIINKSEYARLQTILKNAEDLGAKLIPMHDDLGNKKERIMPLTLLTNVSDEMLVMKDEIFGPILPIISYNKIGEVIDYIKARPRPLALYLYSHDKHLHERLLRETHSGGIVFNDAAFQVANDDLPFGGVGDSGIGSYHGEEGFNTFSHSKSVFTKGKVSFTHLLFPPFGSPVHKLIYKLFIR